MRTPKKNDASRWCNQATDSPIAAFAHDSSVRIHDNKQLDLFLGWLNFTENGLKSLSVTAATIAANTIIKEWEF